MIIESRGIEIMKKMILFVVRILMMPVRLALRILAAAAWLLVSLSSVIAGPFLTLLGVLAVFCAVHQEWRNVAILVILGGIVYGAYFAAGNLIARARNV